MNVQPSAIGGHVAAHGAGPERDEPSWRRRALHGLLIAAGWVLFIWCWYRVTADRPHLGELRTLMLASVLVVPVLTLSWVAHNVGIYRRKGPRRGVREVPLDYATDFNGRTITAAWPKLVGARRVDIVVEGGQKLFVDVSERPARLDRPNRTAPPQPLPEPVGHL